MRKPARQAEQTAELGEWIEWRGGKRPPVADGVLHQVRLRNTHELNQNTRASAVAWDHQRSARDIVAYRVQIKPCRCGPDMCADSVACPRHNHG